MTNSQTKIIWRFLKLLRPFWGKGFVIGLGMTFRVLLELPLPLLTMFIIDDVLISKNIEALYLVSAVLILLVILQGFVGYTVSYGKGDVNNAVFLYLKKLVISKIERLSMGFFHRHSPGYIVSRVISDVNSSEALLFNTFTEIFLNLLRLVVGMVMLIRLHLPLSAISFSILPFFILSLNANNKKTRELSEITSERSAQNRGVLQELISGMRLIKSYVREKAQLDVYEKSYNRMVEVRLKLLRVSLRSSFVSSFLSALGPIIVLIYGGYLVIQGDFTVGQLVAFSSFLAYIYNPVKNLMSINTRIQGALGPVRRIFEILDTPEEVHTRKTTYREFKEGKIEFNNVNFGYNSNTPVLHDINLVIEAKSSVAFVGPSGAGKTTLAELVSRFYDPQSGNIIIDGNNIKDLSLRCVREQVAEVTQESFLFNGTVAENIAFGVDIAKQKDIVSAAKRANAHEFIQKLPKKYNTRLGEKGVQLSGGQMQRIAIARALVKHYPILILDEATSSQDVESEFAIQQAMKEVMKDSTVIIIAHRLSTIKDVDKIVVLDKGRIVQTGNHNKLIRQKDGLYRKLIDRMKEEEN